MNPKTKHIIKTIIVTTLFILLGISITDDLITIYAISSKEDKIYVPIIMYHHVKNSQFGKDVISLYEFESDLKYLQQNNYHTITMTDLIDYVYNKKDLPENPIILSFDDGNLSTYQYVFPLIKKYNMKIVLSIIGKGTDDFSKVVDINLDYSHMTWDQLNEMVESGLAEVQNHTYNLHSTCNGRIGCKQKRNEPLTDYEKTLMEDITLVQQKVEEITGSAPNTFTYPYGEKSDNTDEIIKKLGFKATLSCKFGINAISRDPEALYGLKRICRAHKHGIGQMLKEGMETLKFSAE